IIDSSDRAGKYHQVVLAGHKPRVVAIKRDALVEAGCCAANPFWQDSLISVTRGFLNAAISRGHPPGDAAKFSAAIQALNEWLATARAGDRGGGGTGKGSANESVARVSEGGSVAE